MSIESAITTLIKSDAAISSIIAGRIFPSINPQDGQLPCIVYEQTSGGGDDLTTDGPLGLVDIQFRFTCWAEKHTDVIQLAAALRDLLKDYSGTVGGVTIQCTQIIGTSDISGLDAQSEQINRYGKNIDCLISFNN